MALAREAESAGVMTEVPKEQGFGPSARWLVFQAAATRKNTWLRFLVGYRRAHLHIRFLLGPKGTIGNFERGLILQRAQPHKTDFPL